MKSLWLKNARVISSGTISRNSSIFIENGKISAIETALQKFVADSELDLSGYKLYPGFIDVHNHGAAGVDVNVADVSGLIKAGKFLAANGVTAWLPTLVPDSSENYRKTVEAVERLMVLQEKEFAGAARAVGVHYEGPFVSEKQCGALRTRFFKTFKNSDETNDLPKLKNPNAVHLITVAPEVEGGVELVKQLRKQNWIVSIGHTRADVPRLEAAFEAGAQHLTHFFNAMTGVHHREIGVAGWGLLKKEVSCDIIADGIHVAPQILRFAFDCKTAEKLMLISDSVAPTGFGDGDFEIWDEKISVHKGRTRNARGSIAGSVITMLDAVKMMKLLGISDRDVSQMASLNPARLLGIEKDYGSIEVGKRADLVALDESGAVVLSVVGGQVAFSKL